MLRKPCSKCGCIDYPKYRRIVRKNDKKYPIISSYCIRCHKEDERIRSHSEKKKASDKKYRVNNYKKLYEYAKKWRAENRQRYLAYRREWYANNK